jgi:hypothetical protein
MPKTYNSNGGGIMRSIVIFVVFTSGLLAGVLKEDGLPGIDMEIDGENTRFFTEPSGTSFSPTIPTRHIDRSRGAVLWVDRIHQNAIAEHVALSGNGMWIQAGWYLNNERTSCYRVFGTSTPV